jgi:hypothetical protein
MPYSVDRPSAQNRSTRKGSPHQCPVGFRQWLNESDQAAHVLAVVGTARHTARQRLSGLLQLHLGRAETRRETDMG